MRHLVLALAVFRTYGIQQIDLPVTVIISEKAIEKAVEQFNASEEAYEKALSSLQTRQPVLLGYLFSETAEVFTQKEREFLLYLTLVIYQAISTEAAVRSGISEQQISFAEENNWRLLADVKSRRFHERLDVFFDNSRQEELLSFVEDALSDETDDLVTPEGREAMFVCLKTIMDCLLDDQAR